MTYRVHHIAAVIIGVGYLLSSVCAFAYASDQEREYYHTLRHYSCLVDGQPSAFGLAQRIARGGMMTHAYDVILESHGFEERNIDPATLAYALYVISERIGDRRAKDRKAWLERYLDEGVIDRVTSVVYRKYSKAYLKSCFSVDGMIPPVSVNDIYPLYMD